MYRIILFFHGKKQQIPFARYTSSLIIFLWYIQHVFFSLWYFIFNFLHRWWCSWATAFHFISFHFFSFSLLLFFLPFLKRHVLILLDVHFFVKIIVILFEREEIKKTTLNWWAVEFAILSLFLLSSLLKNNKHGWWTGKTDIRLHWNVQYSRSAFIIYLTFRIE